MNSIRAGGISDTRAALFFGKISLVIVATVHGVVVHQSCDATEAHITERTVRNRARCPKSKNGPPANIQRQVINRDFINVGREIVRLIVDYRRFRRDGNRLRLASHNHLCVHVGGAPDLNDNILLLVFSEIRRRNGDFIDRRIQIGYEKSTIRVGLGRLGRRVRRNVSHGHRRAGNNLLLSVRNCTADASIYGRLLRVYTRAYQHNQCNCSKTLHCEASEAG